MAKNGYAMAVKNAFGFLESYGFIFTKDPMNPSRPCYKNWYGEIVIGLVHDSGWGGKDAEIFVQINGWKTTVNVDEEYKNVFGSKGPFVPWAKKFKKLFEYHANTTGDFYGLRIIKDDTYRQNHINLEASVDDFSLDANPFNSRKEKKALIFTITFAVVFTALAIFAFIFLEDTKSVILYNTVLTIVFSVLFLICVLFAIVFIASKALSIPSAVIMAVYPLLLIYFIYNNPPKIDFQINIFVCFALLLYSIFYVVKYFITKRKSCFANIAAVLIIPLLSLFINSMELKHNVFVFDNDYLDALFLPACIIALIAAIMYIAFQKDKSNKKKFLGHLTLAIFGAFFISLLLPSLFIETTNYVFDDSEGTECTYTVIKKHTSHSSRGGISYWLTINKDNGERMSVKSYIYDEYYVNDRITLVRHVGALGIEYYEYIDKIE